MVINDIKNWFDSLTRDWKEIIKRNIFSWFEDYEESKIENDSYIPTINEFERIFRIDFLSTMIPDPYGSEGYTPDIDLEPLLFLQNLKHLDISFSNHRVSLYEIVPKLLNLKTLHFCGCEIEDLYFLEKLNNLNELDCSQNKISSLNAVLNLPLRNLYIQDTHITQEEIWNFKIKNPRCIINPYREISPFYSTWENNK